MRVRRLVTAVATAAVLLSCVPERPLPPTEISVPAWNCNRFGVETCALPFPSNQFSYADANSPTGRRLKMPEGIIRDEALAQLPARARAAEVFDGEDGFSAAGPIVFEFNGSIDPTTVPANGGNAIQVFDDVTGERIRVDVDLWGEAATRGAMNRILLIWPESRFPFGHTLTAYATRDIAGAVGPLSPAPNLVSDLAADTGGIRSAAERRGLDPERILSYTQFTVRSAASATAQVDEMAAVVRQHDHPVRNVQVLPNLLGLAGVTSIVSGEIRTTEFRTHPDGGIPETLAPIERWVSFLMTVPEYAPKTGAPVVIYSHGIGIPKETMLMFASQNAQLGMATISIDQPNHGARVVTDGGYIFDLVTPPGLARLAGLLQQSTADHVALLLALKTHLKDLDVAPFNLMAPRAANGRADLDTSRVFLEGTSLGGFTGTSFMAVAPEILGATFQVTGTGVLHDLSSTFFWRYGFSDKGGFRGVLPKTATAGEAAALLSAAQFVIDPGDSINVADRIKQRGTPFHVTYTVGDGVVSNASTRALLQLAGIPLFGPELAYEPNIPRVAGLPSDGRGALQLDSSMVPDFGPLSDVRDLLLHTFFLGVASTASTEAWFRQELARTS